MNDEALLPAERKILAELGHLPLDFRAMWAISNVFRARRRSDGTSRPPCSRRTGSPGPRSRPCGCCGSGVRWSRGTSPRRSGSAVRRRAASSRRFSGVGSCVGGRRRKTGGSSWSRSRRAVAERSRSSSHGSTRRKRMSHRSSPARIRTASRRCCGAPRGGGYEVWSRRPVVGPTSVPASSAEQLPDLLVGGGPAPPVVDPESPPHPRRPRPRGGHRSRSGSGVVRSMTSAADGARSRCRLLPAMRHRCRRPSARPPRLRSSTGRSRISVR